MMKGILSDSQYNYVLEHLKHHLGAANNFLSHIFYGEVPNEDKPWISFPPATEALDLQKIIHIENIPVLYPGPGQANSFYSFKGKHLLFHHDLLKSAFHLLSGYQEVSSPNRDQYGRFPHEKSIQKALGIEHLPVVNYYFRVILEGMEAFTSLNQLPFEPQPLLNTPAFALSHDIDLIDAYGFVETGFKFKQLLGLKPSPHDFKRKFGDAFRSLAHLLNPFSRKDPFWSFDTLQNWEAERNIQSTYFFLPKEGHRRVNSNYHFHEKRFRKLFRELSQNRHEIGIHASIQSATSLESMEKGVQKLREASGQEVTGVRQHFLKFHPGETAIIQEKAGLRYDSTLGFAEYEGFRNSYCWPFKMYDFEKDQSMDLWEIPLNCMDVSLFSYRQLDLKESRKSIESLVKEVVKFKGVFSLLWHNHFFNERDYPGITEFYKDILDLCTQENMQGLTGKEICQLFSSR